MRYHQLSHDLKGHLSNIIDEIKVLVTGPAKQKVNSICSSVLAKETLRGSDYRKGAILILLTLARMRSESYCKHEQEKRRHYDQRVREVEHATFTPLVLSTTGGMGRAATTFYKRLASMVAEKRDVPYAVTLNWIRCRLSFALLRASIMSIRGARSSRHHPAAECPIDLQLVESQLN